MQISHDDQTGYGDPTATYIDRLNQRALEVVNLINTLPLPSELHAELAQSWRITRQKLAFFRRELERCDGEVQEELRIMHSALLPQVMQYQIKVGAMMIADHCDDKQYLEKWSSIWNEFSRQDFAA
ncbi:hypothetical protein LEM8419_01073 [Neolewinella maritima]|uniref:Uncharacterized protein n=1 Tax=Neolewinella maritima TaxID=1383882 RepID=A0ABN8F2E4_9BACT|nr:hypothetical protein [Neolewinella maritima]CAH0999773.1 hypothetical protein LEM8419_01073 [Neolewinella maritima]